MKENIIRIDNSEILCYFDVNERTYCALVDKENPEAEVYFALRTKIDDDNCVLSSVPNIEMEDVIKEYNRLIEFFESKDELDVGEEV